MSAVIPSHETAAPAPDTTTIDTAPRAPWLFAFTITALVIVAISIIKWYQHTFSWTVGLDSFSADFDFYWMNLLYAQLILLFSVGTAGSIYLWFSRDRDILNLPATEELRRFYAMFTVLAAGSVVLAAALQLLTEADAAWHQVVVRDTDFTPTHIFLFYLGVPAGLVGLVMAWIWVHTRLPYFAHRVSIPLSLTILGFVSAAPVVAFNEWAHTFFYAEELFSAPVHWFFLLAGFGLFFLVGFVIQCMQRVGELANRLSLEELDKAISEQK